MYLNKQRDKVMIIYLNIIFNLDIINYTKLYKMIKYIYIYIMRIILILI